MEKECRKDEGFYIFGAPEYCSGQRQYEKAACAFQGAWRKKATGKLPIPEKDLEGVDLAGMMDAVSECLDSEIEGDFISVDAADGTKVRIFVGD